jgi:hypothetical protein
LGVIQKFGEWDEEEIIRFKQVAVEYGCGDKWGLFSSYIKGRVGYQCANFYRVLLSRGIFNDPNYKYSSDGTAVYGPK